MSGIVPPIPRTLRTNTGNPSSPNRTNTIPVDITNNATTTNVVQNVVSEDLPQLLDAKMEDSYYGGLEPYLIEILENGPFVPISPLSTLTNPMIKPQKQWSPEDRRLANQNKRLKSIIISCLPNDVMKCVIKCTTAKAIWADLILAHEGPSDTRYIKIAALRLKFNAFKALEGEKVNGTLTRLKCLLNDLENNGVSIPQVEVNATFVNSLPRKWLSMNQTHRANKSIKNDSLATMYGKYNYEEDLIDQIYESETQRFTIQASNSKALISNSHLQDSDSDIKEDTRSSSEFLADLNADFHDRALLANQRRFYKRSKRIDSAKKPIDKLNETCFAYVKLCHFQKECPSTKTFTPSYPSSNKSFIKSKFHSNSSPKPNSDIETHQKDYKGKSKKGFIAESFDWDEEFVSSDEEGVTKVKAFMAIAEDEPSVGKNDASNERRHILNYTHVDLHYVEDQRKNLLNKFNSLNLELSSLPGNIVHALGGRGKKKDTISLKEVMFAKAAESLSETAPEATSDSKSEDDFQVPDNESTKSVKKKELVKSSPVSPSVFDPNTTKKADPSTKQLLISLIEEVKGIKEQIKPSSDNSPIVSQTRSSKSAKGKQKSWFRPCKHSKLKAQSFKSSNSRKAPLIPKPFPSYSGCSRHMTRVKQYLHIYSEESGLKVVFGDNSLGDTKGYGLVNCNGITFTRVAYVNGLKHNLISISHLCDANFKVMFTKTQRTIFNQNNKVVLIAPRRKDVYVIDMSSYNKESNAYFFAKASNSKGAEGSARKRTVAITAEDMQKRKNDVKARTTLLLALPDEHQLRFSKYETTKDLWEAILKTFGGNEATKKTKKN
ncbi:hypothetical protein Tco_1282010 [Tanacetum coccineum]